MWDIRTPADLVELEKELGLYPQFESLLQRLAIVVHALLEERNQQCQELEEAMEELRLRHRRADLLG